jgi:protein-S-isoprenylcysteine O-methyltransferase Ste14
MNLSANVSMLWNVLDWVWVASEVLILLVTRTRSGGGKVQDRGSLLVLWTVIVCSIFAGTWYSAAHAHTLFGGAHWVRWTAVGMLVAGLAIRWSAILTLGKFFSANVAIHATQTLKESGLFRFMRHPSYSGLLLIFAAIGVQNRNWIGLAIVMIPTTAGLLYRIHVEEAALLGAFGQEYERYSRTTKRLIPGVY